MDPNAFMDPNVIVLVSCVAFTGAVAAIARWYAKHPVARQQHPRPAS